jgi:hypothetical protein
MVHADWSKHASKRWLLARPEPAGDPGTLVFRPGEAVGTGRSVLQGCDLPSGLPEPRAGAVVRSEGWIFGQPVP